MVFQKSLKGNYQTKFSYFENISICTFFNHWSFKPTNLVTVNVHWDSTRIFHTKRIALHKTTVGDNITTVGMQCIQLTFCVWHEKSGG